MYCTSVHSSLVFNTFHFLYRSSRETEQLRVICFISINITVVSLQWNMDKQQQILMSDQYHLREWAQMMKVFWIFSILKIVQWKHTLLFSEVQGKCGFPRYDPLKAGFDPKHIEKAEVHHKSRHCPLWPKTHQKKTFHGGRREKNIYIAKLCYV